jgi:hypothetical protein
MVKIAQGGEPGNSILPLNFSLLPYQNMTEHT